MEAVEERRTFEKVMRNLERVGTILRAAFEEFGGVDANSLSTAKEIVGNLDKIEDKEGFLDSFINDWLELPDFRPILEKWIKRACSLYEYNCMDKCVKFEPEQLGEDYEEITDIYEQWRNSIIYWLCKHLRKGEMVDLKDGTIYLKEHPETGGNEDLTEYQKECFAKLINAGYMHKVGGGYRYKWHKSKALLAYTMEKIFCKGNKKGEFPETMLNNMFGKTRLSQARTQLYNSSNPPRGAEGVNEALL